MKESGGRHTNNLSEGVLDQPELLPGDSTLRVLMVEDSEEDAELILLQLRRDGFKVATRRVETRESMRDALAESWDIVLTDHAMPTFSSMGVIDLLRTLSKSIPCIIVSGAIGEEAAVALMRSGALDYVNKDRLTRLGPAVKRALQEAATERARREAEAALKRAHDELEHRVEERTAELAATVAQLRLLEAVVVNTNDAVLVTEAQPLDLPGPRILYSNEAFSRLSGYRAEEVVGKTPRILQGAKTDRQELRRVRQALEAGQSVTTELVNYRKDGSEYWVELSIVPTSDDSLPSSYWIALQRDISQRKRLEDELAEARRRLAEIREKERLYLARELHDGAVQQLIGISYELAESQRRLANPSPEAKLEEALQNHRTKVLSVATQLRNLIRELRPAGLEELGLKVTLENYVSQLRAERGQGSPKVLLEVPDTHLPPPIALSIFRAAQEGLRNAMFHSSGTRVRLVLTLHDDNVSLLVEDDGCGFAVPSHLSLLVRENHFGLVGIEEHVSSVGGKLNIVSVPGRGTELSVNIPR